MLSYDDLKKKYPNKIPIIVNKADNCDFLNLTKNKFLVFDTMNLGEFQLIIRKNLNLDPSKSLILFINKCLFPNSELLSTIQDKHFTNDFLKIIYTSENTFG